MGSTIMHIVDKIKMYYALWLYRAFYQPYEKR